MKLTILAALIFAFTTTSASANPLYTVKCDEPVGHKAEYGSIKDFYTGEEKLRQGEVNWDDGRNGGARPVFVFGGGLGDMVLYTTDMVVSEYIKAGVTADAIELFANYKSAKKGRIVQGSNENGVWVQMVAPTQHGLGFFTLDFASKSMVYANSKVMASSTSRGISAWLFHSKCEWFVVE